MVLVDQCIISSAHNGVPDGTLRLPRPGLCWGFRIQFNPLQDAVTGSLRARGRVATGKTVAYKMYNGPFVLPATFLRHFALVRVFEHRSSRPRSPFFKDTFVAVLFALHVTSPCRLRHWLTEYVRHLTITRSTSNAETFHRRPSALCLQTLTSYDLRSSSLTVHPPSPLLVRVVPPCRCRCR